jgi:hypothetical protein
VEREKGWRREKGCGGEKGRKDVLGNFIVLSKSFLKILSRLFLSIEAWNRRLNSYRNVLQTDSKRLHVNFPLLLPFFPFDSFQRSFSSHFFRSLRRRRS